MKRRAYEVQILIEGAQLALGKEENKNNEVEKGGAGVSHEKNDRNDSEKTFSGESPT